MNKIEAIIRPETLAPVKDALANIGLVGLNAAHVTGRGRKREWLSEGFGAWGPTWWTCWPR
jgi:nitrogen regulatory protein PII